MELRTILTGLIATVVVLAFIVFGLRACTRSSVTTGAPSGTAAPSEDGGDPNRNLTACTADPETGLCSPPEQDHEVPFDWENFMATVREHQRSSRSSSSAHAGIFGGTSIIDRMRGGAASSTAASSPAGARSSSSSSSRQMTQEGQQLEDSASARVVITDESAESSSTGRSGSSAVGAPSGRPSIDGAGSTGNERTAGSFSGGNSSLDDDDTDFSIGDSDLFADDGGTDSDAGGAGITQGSANDGGGFQGFPLRSSSFHPPPSGYGGQVGGQDRGLRGSIGTLPSGICNRGRSLLAIFDPDDVTTGTEGATVPVLIDGGCPVSAAILKGFEWDGGFGGPLNDF